MILTSGENEDLIILNDESTISQVVSSSSSGISNHISCTSHEYVSG